MINLKYGQISDEMFNNYTTILINKLFKILPMKENNIESLDVYLQSLQVELIGSKDLIPVFAENPNFLIILNTIQFFIENEFDNKTCKREVFKCIKIIESF